MIQVWVRLDASGCIRYLESHGHAAGPGRSNLPCAAVSGALRSLARLVAAADGLDFRGEAPVPGSFRLLVSQVPEHLVLWFKGASDLTVRTLEDAAADFPDQIKLLFQEYEE